QTSSLKPFVPNVILEKIIIDLEDGVVSLLEKEKANLETIESLKSKGFESSENVSSESENQTENDCLVVEKECDKEENPKVIAPGMFKLNVSQFVSPISMSKSSYLDTFSSVRRPKNSGVIWKKKGSSNTSNVGETSSASMCNDAMNVSCDSRMNDLLDDNNFFIFDDETVKISPVSKMPFRKKPHDSMNIVQICLWIIDSGCSKHMTGNRALLTNFMEKFFETVRFGNNDFAMIDGYRDVVIVNLQLQVQLVRTDNGTEFKNKTLAKFFDEVVNLLEKEKVNLETIESLKSKSFNSSEKVSSKSENQSKNDCLVVKKECDKKENPKVIASGMFKLNVS
nr:integrase, catalytic region, zinc finger, CCHC-type, peptidase aspartic, catalytic [Tanacetum cinerariifolium]